jgi:hypothetical protein
MSLNKTKKFIEKAKNIHGDLYDYSLVSYVNNVEKVIIVCSSHGAFEISPKHHLAGAGCQKCSALTSGKPRIHSIEKFTQIAKDIHGEKYDYSNSKYIKGSKVIEIGCPIHGVFHQSITDHLNGHGCAKCAGLAKKTTLEFIEAAIAIHKDRYDYSFVEYINSKTPVSIGCKIHGIFSQRPGDHLNGHGCPACSGCAKKTEEEFLHLATSVHERKYSYPSIDFSKNRDSITIECPIHGEFTQRMKGHLLGQGCPKCGIEKRSLESRKDGDMFISQAINVHGDKYDYSRTHYTKALEKVTVTCRKHGDFSPRPNDHLFKKSGCPKCSHNVSSQETEIQEYLKTIGVEFFTSFKPEFLDGKELDIFIPSANFAIEFNGSYWHSEDKKSQYYHFDKTQACMKNGIKLLHIWDFKWQHDIKKIIYKSIINHHLGIDKKIFARKTRLVDIDNDFAIQFIKNNHIEGFHLPYKNLFSLGLEHNDEVVMVALIGQFYEQSSKSFKWKLQRICTKLKTTVVGGLTKMSKEIERRVGHFSYQIAIDTGGTTLRGVVPERKDVTLRYWWIKAQQVLSRNNTQVQVLKKNEDWELDDTENTYMRRKGFTKVYDSGIYNYEP